MGETTSARGRKSEQKLLGLIVIGVVAAAAGAGFVVETINRGRAVHKPAPQPGFDLDLQMPQPAPQAATQAFAPEPLQAAYESPAAAPVEPAAPPQPRVPQAASPAAVSSDKRVKSLLASPQKYLNESTHLGKPDRFRKWIANPKKVERYLDNPLVKGAIGSPSLMRALLQPAVVSAFLQTPAMRDPQSVAALAKSPMLKRFADAPGVQAVLEDPAFVQATFLNPQTMGWLSQNPQAMGVFQEMAPALGAGAPGASGRRR